jgi:hypothetical protein
MVFSGSFKSFPSRLSTIHEASGHRVLDLRAVAYLFFYWHLGGLNASVSGLKLNLPFLCLSSWNGLGASIFLETYIRRK